VFNNLTFAALGVSATLAIGLLGQVGTSALIDQFGWFGVKRRPFRPKHLISFGLILAGIVVMLWQ
ncbi:MAG: EamA-like transporter family protein, partial [Clostridia bacterium]|nr:EamA-like transporter family protein [Clostridia bacterium]